jgi:hypothetical protein
MQRACQCACLAKGDHTAVGKHHRHAMPAHQAPMLQRRGAHPAGVARLGHLLLVDSKLCDYSLCWMSRG